MPTEDTCVITLESGETLPLTLAALNRILTCATHYNREQLTKLRNRPVHELVAWDETAHQYTTNALYRHIEEMNAFRRWIEEVRELTEAVNM